MNSLSIYVNVTTDHWKNQSMRMVLYISVIDILNGLIGNTAHVVYISIPDQLDCQQRRSLLLSSHLLYVTSFYILMYVALDRFLHVWFLSHYKDAVTPAKFNSVLAFYLLVGVWQGLVLSFAPELFGEYKGGIYSAPVNILFITA